MREGARGGGVDGATSSSSAVARTAIGGGGDSREAGSEEGVGATLIAAATVDESGSEKLSANLEQTPILTKTAGEHVGAFFSHLLESGLHN